MVQGQTSGQLQGVSNCLPKWGSPVSGTVRRLAWWKSLLVSGQRWSPCDSVGIRNLASHDSS